MLSTLGLYKIKEVYLLFPFLIVDLPKRHMILDSKVENMHCTVYWDLYHIIYGSVLCDGVKKVPFAHVCNLDKHVHNNKNIESSNGKTTPNYRTRAIMFSIKFIHPPS